MSAILKLVQGTPEWHAYRQTMRNASETAAVMGVSPWLTPYQLWEVRTGRRQIETNAAMRRGSALEATARLAYEMLTGQVMEPLVMQAGDYSASLDGMTFDGSLIVEIKCPMHGQQSSLWQQVAEGEVPEHYRLQVQHQLMVSEAALAHFYVYDGKGEGRLLEISPDPTAWDDIRLAWDGFMACVRSDTPPPLSDRDRSVREDPAWQAAAANFIRCKQQLDAAEAALDEARQVLLALADHPSVEGGGVLLTQSWRAGSVDYRKIPELSDLDLTPYRGAGRLETRITVAKAKTQVLKAA